MSKINFNGEVIVNSTFMIDGQTIGGFDDIASKKFDETKKETVTDNVNRIEIDSDIDVVIAASNTNDVIAHMHGSAIMNGNLILSVTRFANEIKVSVKKEDSDSIEISNSVVINNSCYLADNLVVEIQIPSKDFKEICIQSKNGNIDIEPSVHANTIMADNKNGNINVGAKVKYLKSKSKNGHINVDLEACEDINLDIFCKNGNIDITLGYIKKSEVCLETKNGRIKSKPQLKGIYTVTGSILSKNGNISFH